MGSILTQYQALTHVTAILKSNYTSARNEREHRSGQLHFPIHSSKTCNFLLNFLTDCHRTGPKQRNALNTTCYIHCCK